MKHLTNLSKSGGSEEYDDYRKRVMADPEIIIGKPQATQSYTAEQLESFGIIGVYKRDEDWIPGEFELDVEFKRLP